MVVDLSPKSEAGMAFDREMTAELVHGPCPLTCTLVPQNIYLLFDTSKRQCKKLLSFV